MHLRAQFSSVHNLIFIDFTEGVVMCQTHGAQKNGSAMILTKIDILLKYFEPKSWSPLEIQIKGVFTHVVQFANYYIFF